jgi:hypothetical protein
MILLNKITRLPNIGIQFSIFNFSRTLNMHDGKMVPLGTDILLYLTSMLYMQDISNKGGLAARDWFDKRLSPR